MAAARRLLPRTCGYVFDRLESVPNVLLNGEYYERGYYLVLRIARRNHLFFRDPYGRFRHAVAWPGEGYVTEHRDGTVSAGPWIPSARSGGWEGFLRRDQWIRAEWDDATRARLLNLPAALRFGDRLDLAR